MEPGLSRLGYDRSVSEGVDVSYLGGASIATVVGIVLVQGAVAKLRRRFWFSTVVFGWGLFPARRSAQIARVLPVYELLLGLLMVVSVLTPVVGTAGAMAVTVIAGGTFMTFALVQAVIITRGTASPCGCGGPSTRMIGAGSVTYAGLLSIAAVIAAWLLGNAL